MLSTANCSLKIAYSDQHNNGTEKIRFPGNTALDHSATDFSS